MGDQDVSYVTQILGGRLIGRWGQHGSFWPDAADFGIAASRQLSEVHRPRRQRIWVAACGPELTCWTMPSQIVPAPTKFFQRHSPVHASTYVGNAAGQVRPLARKRLPAAVLTVWSLRAPFCWPGRGSEETTRESSCGLCCRDNCSRGAHRVVGGAAT